MVSSLKQRNGECLNCDLINTCENWITIGVNLKRLHPLLLKSRMSELLQSFYVRFRCNFSGRFDFWHIHTHHLLPKSTLFSPFPPHLFIKPLRWITFSGHLFILQAKGILIPYIYGAGSDGVIYLSIHDSISDLPLPAGKIIFIHSLFIHLNFMLWQSNSK